ncbi:MAG TPA: hypothetical protein VMK65_12075, partial [Longimicrobiales bacterium]|nr:hypothetical protein [Longimicrobiales bacterium]
FAPVPEPSRGIESAGSYYNVRSGGHHLTLLIEPIPCEDIMSGDAFPATVTVGLDGELYHGCGRWLDGA